MTFPPPVCHVIHLGLTLMYLIRDPAESLIQRHTSGSLRCSQLHTWADPSDSWSALKPSKDTGGKGRTVQGACRNCQGCVPLPLPPPYPFHWPSCSLRAYLETAHLLSSSLLCPLLPSFPINGDLSQLIADSCAKLYLSLISSNCTKGQTSYR